MADDVQLTVYVSPEIKRRLDALKENPGIAITTFVEQAIVERLDKVERALKPVTKN